MNIQLKSGYYLHWWGELILIVKEDGFYKLNEVETFFVNYLEESTDSDQIAKKISVALECTEEEGKRFISIFMENYKMVFEYTSDVKSKISISGEKGYHFPLEIEISLTSVCNQYCVHCYKKASSIGTNIDFGNLLLFLNEFSGKTPNLVLTGGNPLNYPFFREVINDFSDKFYIYVMTSGYDLKENDFEILKSVREVKISLYSSQKRVHDKFVCVEGSFDNIMENIKRLIECGVPVSISTLLTKENVEDIYKLIELLIPMKVQYINVGYLEKIGRAQNLDNIGNGRNTLIRCAKEMQEYFKDRINIFLQNEERSNAKSELPFGCMAGALRWAIKENGDILPCPLCDEPEFRMGDIQNYEAFVKNPSSYYEKILSELNRGNEKKCPFIGK